MKLAIMQPYFFPYLGYFQLINAVDEFVIYDDIQFSKRGWIQRNRILSQGKDKLFSIPLKKDSDYLNICDRKLADSFEQDREKILRIIINSYRRAPYFNKIFPLIENCFRFKSNNLFEFLEFSIKEMMNLLQITTKITKSSTLRFDNGLPGQEKVIAICISCNATEYINSIGGKKLYSKMEFQKVGIELFFIETKNFYYKQFDDKFIPNLSIIDVMMFNDIKTIQDFLNEYRLI